MKHWRYHLEGAAHRITVISDHSNLTRFNTTANLNHCQIHWSIDLQKYDFEITHLCRNQESSWCSISLSRLLTYRGRYSFHQAFSNLAAILSFTVIDLDYCWDSSRSREEITEALRTDELAIAIGNPSNEENEEWTWDEGMLWFQDKIYVPTTSADKDSRIMSWHINDRPLWPMTNSRLKFNKTTIGPRWGNLL